MNFSFLSFSEKIRLFGRISAAYVLIALCFILDHLYYGNTLLQEIKPSFMVAIIFYWSVYRPTLIPSWLVFLLGVISDVMTGLPLGFQALSFVLLQWLVSTQRKVFVGQSFLTVLFGFGVVSVAFYCFQWLLLSVLLFSFANPMSLAFKAALSFLTFPLLQLLFRFVHSFLPGQERKTPRSGYGSIIVK